MILSISYANDYLNFLFGKKEKLEAPSQVWAGLCANNPETDGGTFAEISGFGYGRTLLSLANAQYPADLASASGREIKNVRQLVFPKATGAYTARGVGFFSSETGGTPFAYGALGTPQNPLTLNVIAGALPMFEINGFRIYAPGATESQNDT